MRLIGIHPLVKVCAMREEVSNSVLMTRDMCQGIGEILEKSDLSSLMTSDFFVVHGSIAGFYGQCKLQ
jgi:hypothetical protein